MFPLVSGDPQKIGDFLVLNRVGAGGMGTVYLARRGNRRVALKVLNQALLADSGARHRLVREAETLERISSPFVAKLLDWRVSEEEAWLALSFINGPNLREVVSENGPLSGERWWALAAGLAEAISAFHRQDVVHRDLKPSNVIVAENGPVIIDFGISQVLDATRLTRTGTVEGSPVWLSPEQLEVEQVGLESDVFSLGSTLFYAASGQSPWGSENKLTVPVAFSRILENKPDFTLLEADQREFLEPLLRSDPVARPSARELVAQLGPCKTELFSDSEWLDSLERLPVSELHSDERKADEALIIQRDEVRTTVAETHHTQKIPREASEEDRRNTEELEKPKPSTKTESSKNHPDPEKKVRPERPQKNTTVNRRILYGLVAAGLALALVAPGWQVVSALQDAPSEEPETMALEWLQGDLYGESGTVAPTVMGDFYGVSAERINRTACIDEETADVYDSGASMPAFEVQHRSGSWAVVGESILESPDSPTSSEGREGRGTCEASANYLIQSTVERDVLVSNLGEDSCVVMRYREPETDDWLEREERWCVWLDSNPPEGAITLR